MDPDRMLVIEASAGSREAFDELVRRYRRRMYTLVRALTGREDDAEDLVQDVFVRAFRAIGRFRGDSAFRSWLYRIAVNVVRSHVTRQRSRESALGLAGGDSADVNEVANLEDLEETVLRRQVIDRALAALPEDLRVLIVLRDVEGLKYEEIATIVKRPRGTVESRLFRARQRLRPMLEPLMERRSARPVTSTTEELCDATCTNEPRI